MNFGRITVNTMTENICSIASTFSIDSMKIKDETEPLDFQNDLPTTVILKNEVESKDVKSTTTDVKKEKVDTNQYTCVKSGFSYSNGTRYTLEFREMVVNHYLTTKVLTKTCAVFGISRNTVKKWLDPLNYATVNPELSCLKSTRYNQSYKQLVVEHYLTSHSLRKTSRQFGISKGCLINWLKKLKPVKKNRSSKAKMKVDKQAKPINENEGILHY